MSAPEPTPFAVVGPNGIEIADERVCSDDVLCKRTDDGRQRVAAAINAAVQRERQAAAASALREAAASNDDEAADSNVRAWLRDRAERAERETT